ncbi:MAG: L-histidine N(alpha)-methyltransferase [Gammaproteobacteria bacterium]
MIVTPGSSDRISCLAVPPSRNIPDVIQDASDGLIETPRTMAPKYFYDARGSQLFDAICNTPEYYPTRAEESLLRRYARKIIALVQPDHIIEFGSGTSRKTRYLLDACQDAGCNVTYWPFDVCEPVLRDSGTALINEYAGLTVRPLVGDYHGGLEQMPQPQGSCLYLFLGGTIGNFEPEPAHLFLAELSSRMCSGDAFLMGADRVKHPDILHAAYNDAAGITADFNLNLLHVLNRELDADFDVDGFRHQAIYNVRRERIEMYLVSDCEQQVRLGALDCEIQLDSGEEILTEISRKFTRDSLLALLTDTGFSLRQHFEAVDQLYSLVLARSVQ